MKNKKKIIIGSLIAVVVVCAVAALYILFGNPNRLTIIEKEWISNNKELVINVAVLNDVNNFGLDGNGIYFEMLNDFASEYDFTVNPVPFTYGSDPEGLSLSLKHKPVNNDIVIYKDHYVLVSEEEKSLTSANLDGLKIAALTLDIEYLSSYFPNVTFVPYDSRVSLIDEVKTNTEISYALIPLNMFVNQILTNDYYINYHFGDIASYYTLSFPAKDTFSSLVTKFTNTWIDNNLEEKYNDYNLATFVTNLSIQQKDEDILTSKVYYYGTMLNAPFEVISSNTFGGIASVYLQKFSEFSNVEFKYVNYKNANKLTSAIKDNKIDLYFNYRNMQNEFVETKTLINTDLIIIAPKDDYITINNLNSLTSDKVYVLENSNIYYYLNNLGLNLGIYKNERDLKGLRNKNVLIAMDNLSFEYYSNHDLKNYSKRYEEVINSPYTFKVNGDAVFYKLFSKYINTLDPQEINNKGLESYSRVRGNGILLTNLASIALFLIVVGGVVLGFVIKKRRTIKISKKISKEERMKYIDMLTSLKNRNYLSENVDGWNKNTIYPQATIIVDLNNVKYINDTYGTNEGDKQITAAANILIKTQLDNSDIIRTDGNEFLVYMVGYEERRIVSYIRKLYKEFNSLPYEYGAAIGYSMREDDLKTIDDAINEATLDMRSKKESREKGV